NLEDQVVRRPVLSWLAVNSQLQGERVGVGYLVLRDYERPHRAGGVGGLSLVPVAPEVGACHPSLRPVSQTDVIHDSVADDVVIGTGRGDIPSPPSNHDGQLDLVVGFLRE